MCKVKGVACCDESTENYHTILWLPSTLRSVSATFRNFTVTLFTLAVLSFIFRHRKQKTMCNAILNRDSDLKVGEAGLRLASHWFDQLPP